MAASTSARVISADAISGDARSTCCIMLWEAAGMADARPNIPIAPIRIDARLIVSLYFGRLRSLNGRCSDDKRAAELIIAQWLCARPPPRSRSRDRCWDEGSALEPLDRAHNMVHAKCMLGRFNQRKTGNDAFARRKTVGLGAGGGRRGAITGRRC